MTHREFVSIMVPRVNLQSGKAIVKSCWKIINIPGYYLVFDIDHNIVNLSLINDKGKMNYEVDGKQIPGSMWRFNTGYVLAVQREYFSFDFNIVKIEYVSQDKQEVIISGLQSLVGISENLRLKMEKMFGEVN